MGWPVFAVELDAVIWKSTGGVQTTVLIIGRSPTVGALRGAKKVISAFFAVRTSVEWKRWDHRMRVCQQFLAKVCSFCETCPVLIRMLLTVFGPGICSVQTAYSDKYLDVQMSSSFV